jgi:hypothetical protein
MMDYFDGNRTKTVLMLPSSFGKVNRRSPTKKRSTCQFFLRVEVAPCCCSSLTVYQYARCFLVASFQVSRVTEEDMISVTAGDDRLVIGMVGIVALEASRTSERPRTACAVKGESFWMRPSYLIGGLRYSTLAAGYLALGYGLGA